MYLIATAIIVPLNLFVVPRNVLGTILLAGVVGLGVGSIRLAIWRRRHPVISPEERLDDLRKQAPWN